MDQQKRSYCLWKKENMEKTIKDVKTGKRSAKAASKFWKVPRSTLGYYLGSNNPRKKYGRPPVLTTDQENELEKRIICLANVGFPITSKVIRKSVFKFCVDNGIQHRFNEIKGKAGRYWLKGFLGRNLDLARRKAQHLNEARAQKLNPLIVDDYFKKLKKILLDLDITDEPERIFNMDEKGCRLSLHKQPIVYAKKGSKRVHYRGKEHGENVSVVACRSAIGSVIPPMILFKGVRLNPAWKMTLPPGSTVEMTAKGSMTSDTFVKWLNHFSKFKPAGECLLIMDGAKCHLDYSIVDAAESFGIKLLCLPSNTTHELQPFDKTVFKPFEIYWEDELSNFWMINKTTEFTKLHFGTVFSPAWEKAATLRNIKSGFEACGIFPFNPNRIPPEAYAPSEITDRPLDDTQKSPSAETTGANNQQVEAEGEVEVELEEMENDGDSSDWDSQDEEIGIGTKKRRHLSSTSSNSSNVSFKEILETPKRNARPPRQRKAAINSRAVELTKELFKSVEKNDDKNVGKEKKKVLKKAKKKDVGKEKTQKKNKTIAPEPSAKKKRGRPKKCQSS